MASLTVDIILTEPDGVLLFWGVDKEQKIGSSPSFKYLTKIHEYFLCAKLWSGNTVERRYGPAHQKGQLGRIIPYFA